MIEIKAYQCKFCKKYSRSKSVMKKHESKCYHNPVTKACATCANCVQEHYKVDKSAFLVDIDTDVYSDRPMCKRGLTISHLKDGFHKADLRSNCNFWVEKDED